MSLIQGGTLYFVGGLLCGGKLEDVLVYEVNTSSFCNSSFLAVCSSVRFRKSALLHWREVTGSNPVRSTKEDEYVLEGSSSDGRASRSLRGSDIR